jgi:UDP-N-acetylglucosamine:LPS N-acetylglucosamine transferase
VYLADADNKNPLAGLARLWGGPEGKIVLVMTGGSGQFVEWPEKIARAWIPGVKGRIHVIIVAGNNREYVERYDRAYTRKRQPPTVTGDGLNGRYLWETQPHGVTLEVATDAANLLWREKPFYVLDKRLAALMDAADCILTKPGGSTTAEVAYRGVPAVYDAVDGLFEWEKFGVDILVKRGHGVKLRSAKDADVAKAVADAIKLGRNASPVTRAGAS